LVGRVIAVALNEAHLAFFQRDFDAATASAHIASGELHLLAIVIFGFYSRCAHSLLHNSTLV
jgi:hypothetical protein